jgi:pseudaminic acid synthase
MEFKIGKSSVGPGRRAFIIAELSANHNQKFELARRTVKAAKDSGADAIKLQTYTADTMTLSVRNDYFRIRQGTVWDGEHLHDLYKRAYTPWEWHPRLKKYAESLGLEFFSTPFDKSSADFLEKLRVPAYKIASFEITDLPLIQHVAAKGKPVIISTGIARLPEIRDAVNTCSRAGNSRLALLKCTSAYPASPADMNLRTIPDLARRFKCAAGLSDHSTGTAACVAAVALGACVIEKHLILDRKLGGPDAGFSLDPSEFRALAASVREAEAALGRVSYELTARDLKSREFSRSIFASADIRKGEIFSEANIRSVRPAYGLPPKHLPRLLGKKAAADIKAGTPLRWELVRK